MSEVWAHLLVEVATNRPEDPLTPGALLREFADRLLRDGSLSARIVRRCPPDPGHDLLREIYAELGDCLEGDRMFP
jgi:hypothetical protein